MDVRFRMGTSDGRVLDVDADGTESGLPLLFHNGTPSSGQLYAPFVDAASARGLRMISFSRAGYGGSTRCPERSIADVASDVAAVLDHLGMGRFYTLGWSGGGPHALACAALLPIRVIGAATVGGLAPYDAEGLDWMDGMAATNVAAFRAAIAGGPALQAFLEDAARPLATITAEGVEASAGPQTADVDRAAISGAAAAWLAKVFRESVRTGIWGWHDDQLAFVRPWGFEPGDIQVPVAICRGRRTG
jgi:pimeloyl-ACP methyl ester carboxylesterase